ncbi:MAG: SGNH/GDSL hydrolase family protein [Variovorax sp.]|nr:MAG: SGNH/GDSL hydrolase family protein [Variovorax sp.]
MPMSSGRSLRDPSWRRPSMAVAAVLVAGVAAAAVALAVMEPRPVAPAGAASAARTSAIPVAVLGDSNSHAYQDGIAFPPGSGARGGAFHASTLQWTEVLARLRGDEIDLGPWVEWGRSGIRARAGTVLGLPLGRVPRKQDHLHNFAVSGAICSHLTDGTQRQAQRLAALMAGDAERWRRGVVVIRIGLNDWAGLMDAQARTPDAADAPETRDTIARCTGHMAEAIRQVRAVQPDVRIVLVGVANEAADPETFGQWNSRAEMSRIDAALKRFNEAIETLAEATPRTVFFDDDAWVRKTWGSRDADGRPAYGTVAIGSALRVTNTTGDAPEHAVLADHHSGLVYNTLWTRSFVERLREGFGLPLTPVGDAEVARFVETLVMKAPPKASTP